MKIVTILVAIALILTCLASPSLSQTVWPDTPCVPGDGVCDAAGMICSQSKCICPIGQVFNYEPDNKCKLGTKYPGCDAQDNATFTRHSNCPLPLNQVACLPTHPDTAASKCGMGFGAGNCRATKFDCDEDQLLECDLADNTCRCSSGKTFDGIKCRLNPMENCSVLAVPGPLVPGCADKSECLPDTNDGGKLKCSFIYYDGYCTPKEENALTCDDTKFLDCVNASCRCKGEDTNTTWYNNANGVCELLVGQPCEAAGQTCSGSSTCDVTDSKTCKCPDLFEPNGNNQKCVGTMGASCTLAEDCSDAKYLTCTSNGTCGCAENAWNNAGICQLRVGETCSLPGQTCSDTSTCEDAGAGLGFLCNCKANQDPNRDKSRCVGNLGADCDSVEDCNEAKHFICGDDSKCIGHFQAECETDEECKEDEFLVCKDNITCGCDEDSWQNDKSCQLLVGAPCNSSILQDCSPWSTCLDDGNGDEICKCNANFETSPNQQGCVGNLGASCLKAEDCNSNKFLTCNADNYCGCKNDAWLNGDKCQLLIGETCSANGQECTGVSTCKTGKCACGEKMEASGDKRSCIGSAGATCTNDDGCAGNKFLACLGNGTCGCRTDSWLNGDTCEVLVGQSCLAGKCTGNSKCDSTTKRCICGANEEITSDRKGCIGSVGADCTADAQCNSDKYLTCLGDHKCGCHPDSWLNNGVCLLLINKPCKAGEQPCSGSSVCSNSTSVCACAADSVPDGDQKKCLGNLNADCTLEADCNGANFLTCQGSKCSCKTNSWENGGKCQLLIGQDCNSNQGSQQCSASSTCTQNKCACSATYEPASNNRACVGNAGAVCAADKICNPDKFYQCNNNICGCSDNAWLNGEVCELLVGENCASGQTCAGSSACNDQNLCACAEKTEVADDKRKCIGLLGAPCEDADECKADKFLTCANGTNLCTCDTENLYEEREKEGAQVCLGTHGATCTDQIDCDLGGTMLFCTEGKCACADKFTYVESDKKCSGAGSLIFNFQFSAFALVTLVFKSIMLQ